MKDRHNLWKEFGNVNFQKVRYNGVHGNVWAPPMGNPQSDNGFNHIASPHPAPPASKADRIFASDMAGNTMSGSSFDLPPRKNVLQIDIPSSTTKTTTYSYNSASGHAPNLGLSLHGTGTIGSRSLHGRFLEVEKEEEQWDAQTQKATNEALSQAKQIEATATALTGQVVSDPTSLVIPIKVLNKKDTTSLGIALK